MTEAALFKLENTSFVKGRAGAASVSPRGPVTSSIGSGFRPDPTLTLEGITLSFGGVTAVSNVDLSVQKGEIRAIIGPNGAGKSSLINLISGIYRPDSGTIRIEGKSFSAVPASLVAKLRVARTYQSLALFPGLSVIDNIKTALSFAIRSTFIEQITGLGRSRREEDQALDGAEEVVSALRLQSVAHRSVGSLPYGVQKRVELARALVVVPRLLLLDEPMAGMTAGEKEEMVHYVRAARDDFGATIVLIEHDIGVVMGLSDRIAVLDYGRKIADGTPEDVRSDPAVIAAYLGLPREDAARNGRAA